MDAESGNPGEIERFPPLSLPGKKRMIGTANECRERLIRLTDKVIGFGLKVVNALWRLFSELL